MISIVGLGYGSIDDLTFKTFKTLKEAKNVFINNLEYPIVNSLKEEGIVFRDYKELIVNIEKYSELDENVVYAVWGNAFDNDEVVISCKEKGIKYNYVKENSKGKKDINDLIEIIEVLRGENGCPWDKEQTHDSIKKCIIEESYEVFDAIDNNDIKAIVEELGDVLFQVLFHASLGREEGKFTLLDITDGISNKMIYRHPHVFGDASVNNTEEVLVNWDELKKNEKNFESLSDELTGVAKALPALIRAKKIQKKAKKVGFDWDDVSGAFDKVKEELNEVMDVYKEGKVSRIKEEIGDLLFSCVNVSRFLDVDPEEALNLTTDKFINRFSYIEKRAKELNRNLEEMSLEDMDKLWDEAKKLEKR